MYLMTGHYTSKVSCVILYQIDVMKPLGELFGLGTLKRFKEEHLKAWIHLFFKKETGGVIVQSPSLTQGMRSEQHLYIL